MSNPTFDYKTLQRHAKDYIEKNEFPLRDEEKMGINGFLNYLIHNDEIRDGLLKTLAKVVGFEAHDLDELKDDMSAMSMSEQISFLKGLIRSEAIRSAKIKGVTVEEILDSIKSQTDNIEDD